MPNTTRPEPAVYHEDGSYHIVLDDRLVMHLSEKERDAHLAAYAKGQVRVAPAFFLNDVTSSGHAVGFTTSLDEHFSLTYDTDDDIAAIHDQTAHIWAGSDFAQWLIPFLELRGFKRQQTNKSSRKNIYGATAVAVILICTVILITLGDSQPGICAQNASLLEQICVRIYDKFGFQFILLLAVILIMLSLLLSLDFKGSRRNTITIKR